MSVNSRLKANKITGQRKASYWQRIPESSCPMKETVDRDILVTFRDMFIRKASFFWRFCDILYMCYNIIQNLIVDTILNPAIYMFVKLKYQT